MLVPAALQALRELNGSAAPAPLLFAAVSCSSEHCGASSSFEHRFYQNSSPDEVRGVRTGNAAALAEVQIILCSTHCAAVTDVLLLATTASFEADTACVAGHAACAGDSAQYWLGARPPPRLRAASAQLHRKLNCMDLCQRHLHVFLTPQHHV